MSVTYKITYEHRDDKETRSEKVLLHSDHEPTQNEVQEAVRRDTVKFNASLEGVTAVAEFSIISVVPVP